jgi:hypothetical protein
MAAHLEIRRQAIAEALRAVMAEPFPDRSAASVAPTRTVATTAPWFTPAPVHTAEPPPQPAREPVPAPPTLREALAAQINWDEVADFDTFGETQAEGVEEVDDGPEPPSVPPLDTGGSMSRKASMALFGHA